MINNTAKIKGDKIAIPIIIAISVSVRIIRNPTTQAPHIWD
jgi:hypothetical protein